MALVTSITMVVIFVLVFGSYCKFIVGICYVGCKMKQTVDSHYSQILYLRIHLLLKMYLWLQKECSAFAIILGHAQSGKNLNPWTHVPSWGGTRSCSAFLPQLSSINKCPFLGLLLPDFSHFCAFSR